MAPRSRKDELLARVNFPPYTIKMLTHRHILVAGGGGKAKTGISNAIKIYELSYDGKRCRAESSSHYETGDTPIMNCATFHNGKYLVLAAGLDGYCQFYQITFKITHPEEEGELIESGKKVENIEPSVRKRQVSGERKTTNGKEENNKGTENKLPDGSNKKNDKNRNSISTLVGFNVQPLQSIQTDFSKEDPFQNVVRVSSDHKFLVTGGADGALRIWQYPLLKAFGTITAHKDEIEDIDISPTAKQIVSLSRDGHAFVWNRADKEMVAELSWCPPGTEKYRFRNCRYGIVEDDKVNCCLFTSHNPLSRTRQKKAPPSYLVKWDTITYLPKKVQATGTDILSSMAVSDDGRFVAVGTMSGNVDIYIAFSLQRILHSEATHSFFVTGLEFIPTSEEMHQVAGDYDASVVSISVDNQIKIHHIPKQVTISIFWVLLMFVAILVFVFTFMSYIGL